MIGLSLFIAAALLGGAWLFGDAGFLPPEAIFCFVLAIVTLEVQRLISRACASIAAGNARRLVAAYVINVELLCQPSLWASLTASLAQTLFGYTFAPARSTVPGGPLLFFVALHPVAWAYGFVHILRLAQPGSNLGRRLLTGASGTVLGLIALVAVLVVLKQLL